jgi:hypothetical protein
LARLLKAENPAFFMQDFLFFGKQAFSLILFLPVENPAQRQDQKNKKIPTRDQTYDGNRGGDED